MNIQSSMQGILMVIYVQNENCIVDENWKEVEIKNAERTHWTRIAEIDELKTRDNQANERVNR